MRFIAQTWLFTFGAGEYLRILPEPHRLGDPPPPMPAGADLVIGDKPAAVMWAAGAEAVIAFEGQRWLLSHLTPIEAVHRPAYTPGQGCQEWIVRRPA